VGLSGGLFVVETGLPGWLPSCFVGTGGRGDSCAVAVARPERLGRGEICLAAAKSGCGGRSGDGVRAEGGGSERKLSESISRPTSFAAAALSAFSSISGVTARLERSGCSTARLTPGMVGATGDGSRSSSSCSWAGGVSTKGGTGIRGST
jgi:hypothetical protein